MYKICFYVPTSHLEIVKGAMFATNAGKIGEYSHCCWQILGQGQYMPLEGSDAFIGTKNKLEQIKEYKVEMVCKEDYIHDCIEAMKAAHPYEEPAYQVFRLESF